MPISRYAPGRLRPGQIIVFLLIVLVPLAIAAWLGLKVARDEQTMSRRAFEELLESRLRDVDGSITAVVDSGRRELLEAVIPADRAPAGEVTPAVADALRALRRQEPLVREIFVVDARGVLVFPPDDDTASAHERSFRERTAPIWRGDAVLYEPPAAESGDGSLPPVQTQMPMPAPARASSPGAMSTPARARGDTVLALAQDREYGWITWYWEEGLHLLLWQQARGGGAIGVEIERVALTARIIAALPAAPLDDGRVVLVDSLGGVMHQWGPYERAADEQPVATIPVGHPLGSWRLLYFASPAQAQALHGTTTRIHLIMGLAAVGLALVAMAFLFYRDYARKLRDAAERVSFVTQVSHELKTPLTNIRLYAELIDNALLDEDEDEDIRRRTRVIVAESQRLTRLINNILAFSQQQRRQLELSKSWIRIDDVVAAVLAQFTPALAARGITHQHQAEAARPVYADADAMGQIVANLVSNVEKYAASGNYLHIATAQQGRVTTVRVSDRGPGIPAAHRDKIFRSFYRVSDKLADGVTGTGIGLAIARELARRSGGDLTLVPSDIGACFELRIEDPEPALAQPQEPPNEQHDDQYEGTGS